VCFTMISNTNRGVLESDQAIIAAAIHCFRLVLLKLNRVEHETEVKVEMCQLLWGKAGPQNLHPLLIIAQAGRAETTESETLVVQIARSATRSTARTGASDTWNGRPAALEYTTLFL